MPESSEATGTFYLMGLPDVDEELDWKATRSKAEVVLVRAYIEYGGLLLIQLNPDLNRETRERFLEIFENQELIIADDSNVEFEEKPFSHSELEMLFSNRLAH